MSNGMMSFMVADRAGLEGHPAVEPCHSETGQSAYKVDGKVYCVLPEEELQNLLDRYDSAELRLIQIAALAAGEEAWPSEVAHALFDGEDHPLRIIRKYRGLTAVQLAEKAGVSQAYISEIETGKKDGSVSLFIRLADILEVDLDDLVHVKHYQAAYDGGLE